LSFSDPGKKQHFSWVLFAQEKKFKNLKVTLSSEATQISHFELFFFGEGEI
jgi:hypothetical protein